MRAFIVRPATEVKGSHVVVMFVATGGLAMVGRAQRPRFAAEARQGSACAGVDAPNPADDAAPANAQSNE